tara:strand:+ start:408 stop:587 length:180 start_codon:yes stop_codon:yes gene_type:complete
MITIEKNFNKKNTFEDIDYFISSIVDNMEYKADFEVDMQVSHVKDDVKVILIIFERKLN